MTFRYLFASYPFCHALTTSAFRSIPDNQEVYVSNQTETSLLIDILERVPSPDSESAQFHFEALGTDNEVDIEDDEDAERVFFVKRIQAGKLPYDPVSVLVFFFFELSCLVGYWDFLVCWVGLVLWS